MHSAFLALKNATICVARAVWTGQEAIADSNTRSSPQMHTAAFICIAVCGELSLR